MNTLAQYGKGQQPPLAQPAFDIRQYIDVLRKRKLLVAVTFVCTLAIAALITLRQQKVYSSSTSLVIESTTPQILGEVREAVDLGTSYWYTKEFYETQYKIIRSRSIAEKVVQQLGLTHDVSFLGLEHLQPGQLTRALDNADAAAVLQSRLFVEPTKDSRVVHIRFEDFDAERAALIANTVAQTYIQANLDRRVEGSKDAASWLEDQLADLKGKLSTSELALFNFRRDNDLVYATFENKQSIASQKLVAINDALTKVRTKKAEVDARVKGIRTAKRSNDISKLLELGVVASNPFVNSLKLKYLETESEAADLRDRYGPSHPRLRTVEEKLQIAKANLLSEIDSVLGASQSEYDEVASTEANLERMLEQVKAEAFEINKKEIDYKRLAREEENNQRLYDMVLKRMKELDLSSLLKSNNVRVLDSARVLRSPIRPRVQRNLAIAGALGLLAGIGLAFFIEIQDRTVKSHQEIEALGLNFLGLIPSISEGAGHEPRARDLFVDSQPKSSVAECCRTIRSNLLFMGADKPARRLVVTSAGPQEGKTTTLINLGITLAQAGSRVLLVDTDMRRPRLHKSFGISNQEGLSKVIVGEGSLSESVKPTNVPGLHVLPSGPIPPNPAELLHTSRFREISEQLGAEYDRVLFDSPPIGAVADPLLLANQLDGTVLVVKMLKTDRIGVERAAKALADANARVLGAVLNDVDLDSRNNSYYVGYYYSYGRYYRDQSEDT